MPDKVEPMPAPSLKASLTEGENRMVDATRPILAAGTFGTHILNEMKLRIPAPRRATPGAG